MSEGRYHVRWFTPQIEVELCGHAMLASGYVVLNELHPGSTQVTFDSLSGPLVVRRRGDLLELDFPARPAQIDLNIPPVLVSAVGGRPQEIRSTQNAYLLVYESNEEVAALTPDFRTLRGLGDLRVLATAPGKDCDFVSRCFHDRQISARTGELWCELISTRVKIAGHAVLNLRGTIAL